MILSQLLNNNGVCRKALAKLVLLMTKIVLMHTFKCFLFRSFNWGERFFLEVKGAKTYFDLLLTGFVDVVYM